MCHRGSDCGFGSSMTRFSRVLPIAVLLFLLAGYQQSQNTPPLVVMHVNLIDATGSAVQPDMTVMIRADRIMTIKKSSDFRAPAEAKVINAHGQYMIPGLWDMHVHTVFGDWLPKDEEVTLPLFVANGVTGVRDMGGDLETLRVWRSQIGSGKLLGPRMVLAGP